jgi:hypothetical protein
VARTVSLTTITEDIRQRCDLPTFTSSTFITSTAVTRFINVSLQRLYGLLQQVHGEEYFAKSTTLSPSSATTALPSDFLRVLKMLWLRGTNDIVEVPRAKLDELYWTQESAQAWTSPRYRLQGTNVLWHPVPNQTYSVKLFYVYAPADLASGSDTFDAGPGWEEFVVADVCRMIDERQDKPTQTWLAMLGDAERRIREQAPRHDGDGLQIRDVMGREYARGDRAYRDWLTTRGY